mgnify:CR=1 FL=1
MLFDKFIVHNWLFATDSDSKFLLFEISSDVSLLSPHNSVSNKMFFDTSSVDNWLFSQYNPE